MLSGLLYLLLLKDSQIRLLGWKKSKHTFCVDFPDLDLKTQLSSFVFYPCNKELRAFSYTMVDKVTEANFIVHSPLFPCIILIV